MADQVKTPQKTNDLAVIGLLSAFIVPVVGLALSIVGLVQINRRKEKGRGIAISGIVAAVLVGILQVITLVLIVAAVKNSTVALSTYTNNDIGYSVKYPKGWQQSVENDGAARSVIFKGGAEKTGKVTGQVEVVHIGAPKNGYKTDVLVAIRDALKKDNPNTAAEYMYRQDFKDRDAIRMILTYDGENGRVKAKYTIMLNQDKSVYTIATQTPEPNWSKYSDAFDEIHASFEP